MKKLEEELDLTLFERSKNKITLEQITEILKSRGSVKIFEHRHNAFNAGKTDLKDHKEFLFICEVANG